VSNNSIRFVKSLSTSRDGEPLLWLSKICDGRVLERLLTNCDLHDSF